ncbi:MAG TPA: exodeoxyribonuclease VII small subunit [Candidatus Dormibacteraeota bacterium]|nr:exodeoxyribonuclease VII small subunit [Candidatus Dormibacteraeota bacterium]
MSLADPEIPVETARFEDLLTTLEKTIAELAGGIAPLEELVAAHQRALLLLAEAQSRLDELKARADLITRSLKNPTNSEATP